MPRIKNLVTHQRKPPPDRDGGGEGLVFPIRALRSLFSEADPFPTDRPSGFVLACFVPDAAFRGRRR